LLLLLSVLNTLQEPLGVAVDETKNFNSVQEFGWVVLGRRRKCDNDNAHIICTSQTQAHVNDRRANKIKRGQLDQLEAYRKIRDQNTIKTESHPPSPLSLSIFSRCSIQDHTNCYYWLFSRAPITHLLANKGAQLGVRDDIKDAVTAQDEKFVFSAVHTSGCE
jgi:hypothetical protein